MTMPADSPDASKNFQARIFAAGALLTFAAGVAYAGSEGYRAATDSFVAPMILSPESELVLQTKAKISELEVERHRILTESEAIDLDLAAADAAIARLKQLQTTMSTALDFTKGVTAHQTAAGHHELAALERQKAVLGAMAEKQARITREANANLEANLISKADQAREQIALDQVTLALLENERARLQSEAVLSQAQYAQSSLSAKAGTMTPEAIAREEQLVRIELEISRLELEQRSKRAEKKVVLTKLAKMEELEAQLKGRPIFRATERSIEVAFVPYTQSEGVERGSVVYDCVWSIFRCKPVGTITEIVPGEIILPDPWGNQARGQYAVLSLDEHESAKSKVLRVRPDRAAVAMKPQGIVQSVSMR